MAQLHELDLVSHWGDDYDDVSKDSSYAEIVAQELRLLNSVSRITPEHPMLGLGVGQGYQEVKLAEILGVSQESVVLLDRNFSPTARERLARVVPNATLIERGMFSYLNNPDGRRYSLVTTFGLHDVLRGYMAEEFFRFLPNVLADSAMVFFISTPMEPRATRRAAMYGFTPVTPNNFVFEFKR